MHVVIQFVPLATVMLACVGRGSSHQNFCRSRRRGVKAPGGRGRGSTWLAHSVQLCGSTDVDVRQQSSEHAVNPVECRSATRNNFCSMWRNTYFAECGGTPSVLVRATHCPPPLSIRYAHRRNGWLALPHAIHTVLGLAALHPTPTLCTVLGTGQGDRPRSGPIVQFQMHRDREWRRRSHMHSKCSHSSVPIVRGASQSSCAHVRVALIHRRWRSTQPLALELTQATCRSHQRLDILRIHKRRQQRIVSSIPSPPHFFTSSTTK